MSEQNNLNYLLRKTKSLEGIDLINFIKAEGIPVASYEAPTIFKRLDSLNNRMAPTATNFKIGKNYYYLIEQIEESKITCYTSLTMDLLENYVLDLKAVAYNLFDTLTSYPNQTGYSSILVKKYELQDVKAYKEEKFIFEPWSGDNNINFFTDSFTQLTQDINTSTSNRIKLYSMLFFAKSNIDIGESYPIEE